MSWTQVFVERIKAMSDLTIDYLILNAGILKYPNVRLFLAIIPRSLLMANPPESNGDLYLPSLFRCPLLYSLTRPTSLPRLRSPSQHQYNRTHYNRAKAPETRPHDDNQERRLHIQRQRVSDELSRLRRRVWRLRCIEGGLESDAKAYGGGAEEESVECVRASNASGGSADVSEQNIFSDPG